MRPPHSLRDDAGSTVILIIFSAVLALALILGVTAATSLYLERKRLFTLADGAALAAAESFDLTSVTTDGRGSLVRPVLTDTGVNLAAQAFIARISVGQHEGFQISRANTVDGRSATVELTSFWRPPVVSLFFPDGIRLGVESTARSIFF